MAALAIAALAKKYNIDVADSYREYILTNDIMSISSGIITGAATLFWIRSLSTDLVMPLLDLVLLGVVRLLNAPIADRISTTLFSNNSFRGADAFRETVTWAITLTVTFAVMHFLFRRLLLRLDSQYKNKTKNSERHRERSDEDEDED